ncbi:hypothetical protein EP01_18300 [Bdellovibrio bacteriovorus]|nr:hypothetical protein EP01_18300 [Bdellovibrio bacteriovorus]
MFFTTLDLAMIKPRKHRWLNRAAEVSNETQPNILNHDDAVDRALCGQGKRQNWDNSLQKRCDPVLSP